MKQWKCGVCGYIHKGNEPPDQCPVCGADKSQFELIQDEPTASIVDNPLPDPQLNSSPESNTRSIIEITKTSPFRQRLTRLHMHPIFVHIPNGVLPIAVIFTFLAFLFKSDALAAAARYNMLFVMLTMPAVIFSGWNDWQVRYGGKRSKIFDVKIGCAISVTFFSIVITAIWVIAPQIHLQSFSTLAFFSMLNLINLLSATIAGLYGGKLVFPNN